VPVTNWVESENNNVIIPKEVEGGERENKKQDRSEEIYMY